MLLIHHTSMVITLAGGPQRGHQLGNLSSIPDGAVALEGETIREVGPASELLKKYPQAEKLDARGNAVIPGFVDPHTHVIWAGDRAGEFEMRLQGKSYMEIMATGGGILATVKATRQANLDQLVRESLARTELAFKYGTTTMEAKTGYGLDLETECKQLAAILKINHQSAIELVPTYLGAHAIPPEFKGDPQAYTNFLVEVALPFIRSWWFENAPGQALPFVDVFCEFGVFDLQQTRTILQRAMQLGFPLKLHADEFENLGGASLAAELGAASADHLVKTSAEDIRRLAQSHTVAVALPGTPFGLGQNEFPPARQILEADGYLALATDLNPGTIWNESMQFIQALACRYLRLSPAEALAGSTINAAAALNLADKIGSLEAGKQADMLILRVPDYRHLAYRCGTNLVAATIKKGIVYPTA